MTAGTPGTQRAVLFDIDGTLVDSNYLHIDAWSRALESVGNPVDAWRIHRGIGMDSSKLLTELLADREAELGDAAKDAHTANYAGLTDRLRPFEGARDLLRELHTRGFTVVLATSAPDEELKELRACLDIEDALDAVTSSEDVEQAKPDPDIVKVALDKAGVDAASAVFVGDTVWDAEAAGRAGVDFVGVLSGGISAAELTEAGAIAVYRNVEELLRELDSSPLTGG